MYVVGIPPRIGPLGTPTGLQQRGRNPSSYNPRILSFAAAIDYGTGSKPKAVLAEAMRVCRPGGVLFFRDLLRPPDAARLQWLVETYAGTANAHQRALFAASLQAALTLAEMQMLVALLGFAPESVQQTSDRHWTWSVVRPA